MNEAQCGSVATSWSCRLICSHRLCCRELSRLLSDTEIHSVTTGWCRYSTFTAKMPTQATRCTDYIQRRLHQQRGSRVRDCISAVMQCWATVQIRCSRSFLGFLFFILFFLFLQMFYKIPNRKSEINSGHWMSVNGDKISQTAAESQCCADLLLHQ